jgi:acyl dehydratase
LVNVGGARMTTKIEFGFAIPERVVLLDRQMLKAYADASGDQNPIHQNEEFALSVGLPNVIAHGMLTMALVGKYVTDWSGGSSSVKEFGARFIKPVIVPANEKVDLTINATVSEVDGDQIKLDLVATSAGVKVLGMAKAVVIKQ